jgi:hypothetical protein
MSEVNGVKIPNEATTLIGAPEQLVAAVHRLGESEGYERVRLDRGTAGSGAWYEVGFAGGQVRVRWSHVGTSDFAVQSADTNTLRVITSSMRMNISEAQKTNGGDWE